MNLLRWSLFCCIYPRDAQRAVPLKGSGSSRSLLHPWLRHGASSRSTEKPWQRREQVLWKETGDPRPADPLRGRGCCIEQAVVVASSSFVTSLPDKQERQRHSHAVAVVRTRHCGRADHANSNDDVNAQHEEGGVEANRSWRLQPVPLARGSKHCSRREHVRQSVW